MNRIIDDDFQFRLFPAGGQQAEERASFVRKFGNHRPSISEYVLWSSQYHSGLSTVQLSYDRKYADQLARKGKAKLCYAVLFMNNRRNRLVIAAEDKIVTPFVSIRKKEQFEDGRNGWTYTFYDLALTKRQAELIFRAIRDGDNRAAGNVVKKYLDEQDTYNSVEDQYSKYTNILNMIPPKWRGAWNDELENVIMYGKQAGYYETVIVNS